MEQMTLTEHARVRLDSRRIPAEAVEMALLFGREVHAKGATFYAIGRREVDRSEESGIDLKRYEGIQVICVEDHVVVTAYRNRDFSKLRLRRPKKKSGTQRGRYFGPRIHEVAA